MATARHSNNGLRKICDCSRRRWAKCPHDWHFNFKPRGGRAWRFSLDVELGRRLKNKEEAQAEAENIRVAIRAGTFVRSSERQQTAATATTPGSVTLATFGETYAERLGKPVSANHQACFKQFCAFIAPGTAITYGARALSAFTEDDIEAFFRTIRGKGFAESTINKYVQMVKALFRWATKKGYLTRNPAADSDVLKRRKHAQRQRRLGDGEEARLLASAGPHLHRLIIAALETGCRRGELLSLTWRDVNLERREMTIRSETTKTKTGRVIPISTRLAAVLEMARTDPTGKGFGPEAFVFGDVTGAQIKDIKRAWETCVIKAHDHTPMWTRDHALAAASREALRVADHIP